MALPESRRQKLDMLIRSLAAGKIKQAEETLRAAGRPKPPRKLLALEEVAPGAEASNPQGAFWLIRRRLAEVSPEAPSVQKEYLAVLRGARHRFDEMRASAALCHVADGQPEGPLFLDVETCGLAGTCVFMIGLMSCRDGELVFDQLLARHYGQEPAILAAFAERMASAETLVSFNGKAFDMTNIRERAAFHGLALPAEPPHCDVLHESRRRWRDIVPDCRLQTLEQYLCRRRRVGDVLGSEIPDVYHGFVADGDATRLKSVLHHNLLDLLTTAQLLCLLLTGEEPCVDL